MHRHLDPVFLADIEADIELRVFAGFAVDEQDAVVAVHGPFGVQWSETGRRALAYEFAGEIRVEVIYCFRLHIVLGFIVPKHDVAIISVHIEGGGHIAVLHFLEYAFIIIVELHQAEDVSFGNHFHVDPGGRIAYRCGNHSQTLSLCSQYAVFDRHHVLVAALPLDFPGQVRWFHDNFRLEIIAKLDLDGIVRELENVWAYVLRFVFFAPGAKEARRCEDNREKIDVFHISLKIKGFEEVGEGFCHAGGVVYDDGRGFVRRSNAACRGRGVGECLGKPVCRCRGRSDGGDLQGHRQAVVSEGRELATFEETSVEGA